MPFKVVDRLGPTMRQVDGGRDLPMGIGKAILGVDVGHFIVTREDLVVYLCVSSD